MHKADQIVEKDLSKQLAKHDSTDYYILVERISVAFLRHLEKVFCFNRTNTCWEKTAKHKLFIKPQGSWKFIFYFKATFYRYFSKIAYEHNNSWSNFHDHHIRQHMSNGSDRTDQPTNDRTREHSERMRHFGSEQINYWTFHRFCIRRTFLLSTWTHFKYRGFNFFSWEVKINELHDK